MATEYGNIDDFLESGKTASKPETPEHQDALKDDYAEESSTQNEEYSNHKEIELHSPSDKRQSKNEVVEEEEKEEAESNLDDYGNEKPPSRTYTQDEVDEKINKAVRDRLSRGNQQQTPQVTQQQIQQATDQGFEYNENSEVPWEQQLEKFVEKTLHRVTQKQQAQQQKAQQQQMQQKEKEAENEFMDKFVGGMDRFKDFKEVVEKQPVTEFMTMALRGIKDPSAFIYAASKRASGELQRISRIEDPYTQIVEMGKLEERMRKSPQQTKTPRPVARTREDGTLKIKNEKREEAIDDLLVKSDAKRRAQLEKRRGR